MIKKCIFYLFILLAATGCRTWKAPALPPVELPSGNRDTSSFATPEWRALFTDTVLIALIDSVLSKNYDRKIALTHVLQTEAFLLRARAPLLPQVQGVIAGGGERFGDYTMNGIGNYDLNRSENVPPNRRVPEPLVPNIFTGFQASWEIDIWKRLRAGKESARAQMLASIEGVRWLNTNLVASVATLYYELLALDAELAVTIQNIQLQEQALEVMEAQKAAGRASELAVQQFRAQVFNTKALQLELQQHTVAIENQIKILTGTFSGPIRRGPPLSSQTLPSIIKTGIPARYLLNRPDVRKAEQQLSAAGANVYAARAAFLPSLTLNPYAGFQAFRPSVLFSPQSAAFGLLGGAMAPLLNRRAIKADYHASLAHQQEAWLRYQGSLIQAHADVQTALQQYEILQAIYPLKLSENLALERAAEISKDLYLTGFANYLEVIFAQKNALQAAIDLQELRKQQFINVIDLYRSLGGS